MDMFGGVSRWVNPTPHTVKLDLCVQAGADKNDQRLQVEIPPVGSVVEPHNNRRRLHQLDREGRLICTSLPTMFDAGIHIIRDGIVVGGLAPQLRKLDEEEPEIAPELDPLDTKKKEEFENATLALAQKEAAERQLILSGAKVAEINDQQKAIADAAAAAEKARQDAETQLAEADKARAEVAQMKAEAEKMKAEAEKAKADAEKAKKEAAKATAEAAAAKKEADAAVEAATAPKTPEASSGAGGDSGKGGKATK